MLRALMDFPYAGKTRKRGETFMPESANDAHLLVLAKRAEAMAVTDDVEPQTATYETKDKAKRYHRRDLRAEA